MHAGGGTAQKPIELAKNGGHDPARPDLILILGRETRNLLKNGLGRAMLNDFGRGANRMGSKLLNDS